MNEPDVRLRALDPAANEPYRHPDLESMIARITGRPARTRVGWRGFRLKLAGAVAASALVTVAAIVALENAVPSLPLLAVQGTAVGPSGFNEAQTAAPAAVAATLPHFAAGAALSRATSTGVVVELRPSAPGPVALRLAKAFDIARPSLSHRGRDWLVRGRSGANLDYQPAPVPQWYYSSSSPKVAPATESEVATGVPSHATLEATVTRYLARAGLAYHFATPRFTNSTVSGLSGTSPTTTDEETLTAVVTIDGVATDQTLTFTVDRHDVVLYAAGPVLAVQATYRYPLRAPAGGVTALNRARHAPGGASVSVTLTSVRTSLRAFRLVGGTTWLLPVYRYRAAGGGAPLTPPAEVLAVAPRYVSIASSASGVSARGVLEP